MHLFVNDLTVIDFSYLCPARGMVGESWIVDIVLDGSLNEQSMVLDFGRVKKQLKAIIDEAVDHKLAVPTEHPYTQVSRDASATQYQVDFLRPQAAIHLSCPADAYAFIEAESISPASILGYLQAVIKRELPQNVAGLELTLRPEAINGFYYHYTHGLKKHDGNCQRIAHGHRSRIMIHLDGMRQPAWEKRWSQRWADIYIGTAEDVVEPDQLSLLELPPKADTDYLCYSYEAEQGRFELALPEVDNEIMDTDSTVECIAQYVARIVKEQEPERQVKVTAFEGVGKGAIGFA